MKVPTDIYSVIALGNFQFTVRKNTFDWRLLHGLAVDDLVRLNDVSRLEAIIPALQQGSIDAEGNLSSHNYVQLSRLVQLAVEHLWQMRESHSKLYPAYVATVDAANRWADAASAYLGVGGQLLSQLQSEQGTVLTEQLLGEVATARERLEQADADYNKALDKLEAEDKAARGHTLRRQRLEVSWRLVFGVDVQHMLITGSVLDLEALLPQVAYGNIMAEDPAALTPAHFRQLLLLGQACLDYLHAICCATSRVLEAQVQQLAASSQPIPALTTACADLRGALAEALSGSINILKAGASLTPPGHSHTPGHHKGATTHTASVKPVAAAAVQASRPCSPRCQQVAHLQMTAHQGANCSHAGATTTTTCSSCCCHVQMPASPICCHTRHMPPVHQCTGVPCTSTSCCAGVCGAAGHLMPLSPSLPGRLLDLGLTPAAHKVQLRVEQLERDLRCERECAQDMQRALEEITSMLEGLPPQSQHTHPHPHKHSTRRASSPRQEQHVSARSEPHTVNVPVNISLSGTRGRRYQESPSATLPDTLRDPTGAVRVLINEDTIREQERTAAGQQLSGHISDVIMSHRLGRSSSPNGSSSGGGQSHGHGGHVQTRPHEGSRAGHGPFVTVRSVPSGSGGTVWRTVDVVGTGVSSKYDGDPQGPGDTVSGSVRGWSTPLSQGRHLQGGWGTAGLGAYSPQRSAAEPGVTGGGTDDISRHVAAVGGPTEDQQTAGVGLGHFMNQQLQLQHAQQQWPRNLGHAGPASGALAGDPACADDHPEHQDAHSTPVLLDPHKKPQQDLFKEAAAVGFRKLLRGVSPKRMFGAGPGTPPSGPAPIEAPGVHGPMTCSRDLGLSHTPKDPTKTSSGSLQWPHQGHHGTAGSAASSPETSPGRSGRSFTASAAAKAAVGLSDMAGGERSQLASPGQFSPLKASIVANT